MSEIVNSISIIFAVISFLFNMVITEVNEILITKKPDKEQKEKVDKFYKKTKASRYKLIFITIIYSLFFIILLPKNIKILRYSKFDLWDFDILTTLFVIFEFIILIFIIYAGDRIIKLSKKIKE
ncbi:MAG TPA: hypothetical protein PL041_03705 [Melioribacteraceae bacterium]|nr:hypothetical protein [Melioribacteraceae bacterium]